MRDMGGFDESDEGKNRGIVFLNLRRVGLGVFGHLPQVFGTPVHESFPHILWKFQIHVAQGRVTSSDLTSEKKFDCSS